MEKIEISEETLRGIYLIMCGISSNFSGSEVYDKALPVMKNAYEEILKLGKIKGFDCRGKDI